MNLQQLEYLVALDTHRNFVRAAEACHVTQPTLSMQVKKLEEEWGLRIFLRGNGPLEPTELGATIVSHARRVLAEADALRSLLRGEQSRLDGSLRLAAIPTASPYVLPRFLHDFSQAHPGLQLHVQDMQSEAIISALKEGSIDVGLLALPVDDPELEELPIYREPLWLCASSRWAEQDWDLGRLTAQEGPLVLSGGNCLREQVLGLCGTEPARSGEVFYEGGSLETLIRLVGQGQGYTLVPELALPAQAPPGTVIRALPEPTPEREMGLLIHQRFVRKPLLERLGEAIRKGLPPHLLHRKGRRLVWRK